MRVIFACAGTGGHINPAIAIAKMIQKHQRSEILFIGTKNGLENQLVKNADFEIKHIRTGKLIRSFTLKNIKAVIDAYRGIGDAKKIIQEFKPDLVIGTGGYICGPVMLAAKELKIPYILHESNAFPGVSVKLLAKSAKYVMLGFEDAKNRLKRKDNLVYTGTPAKFNELDFAKLNQMDCRKKLGLAHISKKMILVTCGSQGAKRVNEAIVELLQENLSEDYYIILVTGQYSYEEIKSKLEKIQKEKKIDLSKYIRVEKFIYQMDEMYKAVDMCITRAGAMTITELALTRKPAILIPLPTAAENHQYYNAKVMENFGAGKILEQKDLTAKLLDETIKEMLQADHLEQMEQAMNQHIEQIVPKEVENKIYKCIENVVQK